MKHYYYFVSALKDIALDAPKPPYKLTDFVREARAVVTSQDVRVLAACLHRFDNANLIAVLDKKAPPYDIGVIPEDELAEGIKDPALLPAHMRQFLTRIRDQRFEYQEEIVLEDELAHDYYEHIMRDQNPFLAQYFARDALLRNALAAINAREFGYAIARAVLPLNHLHAHLTKSAAPDFGLSAQHPWISDLLALFQSRAYVDLELKMDQLRFDWIDEILVFDMFSVNRIAGYLIKLIIVDKWSRLKSDEGARDFESITADMVQTAMAAQEAASTHTEYSS